MAGEDEELTLVELHIWQLASETEKARNVTVRSRREWVREKVLNMAHAIEGGRADEGSVMGRRRNRQRLPCSIEGCSGLSKAWGLCGTHYARLRRQGDPLTVKSGRVRKGEVRANKPVVIDGVRYSSQTIAAKILGVSQPMISKHFRLGTLSCVGETARRLSEKRVVEAEQHWHRVHEGR